MTSLNDIVQKAFYLGVGLASYATEKAGVTLQELKVQAQKLADEMVSRGEMTTEEAKKYVDDLVKQAQQESGVQSETATPKEPRLIEIVSEDDEPTQQESENLDALRQQVQSLKEELRQIKRQ